MLNSSPGFPNPKIIVFIFINIINYIKLILLDIFTFLIPIKPLITMKEKVKKAIICAAGFGTRFLPITKSIPKEMLNIIDTPAIEFIIQEVLQAGIKDILIVVSSNKNAIIDYFDSNYQLEQHLSKKQKDKELQSITQYNKDCNIFFIRQHYPQGLGDAISYAKSFVGDEPFAVLLGDDVIINHDKKIPSGLQQCLTVFNKQLKSLF